MILFTPFVIVTFTAVGNVVSETYKKAGDKAVLSPGSVSGPITSITWKHGADLAVEWYGEQPIEYRDFKGRCEVNNNTGALTITNLSVKDSGRYTAEINNRVMKTTEIKVITAVPKPTIFKQCNPEVTQCTLTCNANITKDTGPVIYSWEIGDRQISESPSNQLDITKDDTESVGKPISCQLKNPVSSERSDDIMSPITNESSVIGITAGVIVFIVLVALIALAVYFIWYRKKGNNAGLCQYCAHCNVPNPAERSRGTDIADVPVTVVGYTTVPTQDGQPVSTGISNGVATSSESQTVKNQDQPEPDPTGTNKEAEISPESQEDPNQHQPEPEPTGTNNGAEMPNNTSESQNEAGSDQTPAESTEPISEAETSAGAPNAEEPPDHHHQQEDETTEE